MHLIEIDFPEWTESALCTQTDAELWYPRKAANGNRVSRAKQICQRCPVRSECLEAAMERVESFGVWGGLTVKERRKLARERAAA